jgi:hypothetical protein
LWLPESAGKYIGPEIREAMKAVEDYDPNLSIGQHERTGEWVVLLKRITGETVPIFGLGPVLPSREALIEKLYSSDVRRHGGKIAEAMNRRDEAAARESGREADNATGEMAEAFVWAARKDGSHPSPRIFVPSGK